MGLLAGIKTLEDASGSVICGSPVSQRYELETKYTVNCQKTNHCPFAEEHQPIEMFLEVIDETQYDNCTSSFFIRDIIKPDPPECEHVVKNGIVTWKYPRTWSTPKSYFPLTFKVNAEGKSYDTDEQFIRFATTSKLDKIYVQARDRYYSSSWSDQKLCSTPRCARLLHRIQGKIWSLSLITYCVDCSEFKNVERGRETYCAKIYQPYCGSDGKTYTNKCSFCAAVKKSNGTLRLKQTGEC
ncbi:Interleukin-12 subunit beta [Chelonia mydas]|uniref:Interleukin-12 subunit beta n=1 Tax=Chelonia mydas TaxID=8469 RepID=M7CBQ5_CHEMY|nr:Interleukin-12 subunit beta [Chelonia mydas]